MKKNLVVDRPTFRDRRVLLLKIWNFIFVERERKREKERDREREGERKLKCSTFQSIPECRIYWTLYAPCINIIVICKIDEQGCELATMHHVFKVSRWESTSCVTPLTTTDPAKNRKPSSIYTFPLNEFFCNNLRSLLYKSRQHWYR